MSYTSLTPFKISQVRKICVMCLQYVERRDVDNSYINYQTNYTTIGIRIMLLNLQGYTSTTSTSLKKDNQDLKY